MKSLKNIIFTLNSINRSIFVVLMLTFGLTACVESEWSPYTSKATLYSTIVTAQPTTIYGTTAGDPTLMWAVQVLQGSDFCTAVAQTGHVGSAFGLKIEGNFGDEERIVKVRIAYTDGYTNEFTIRQLVKTKNVEYDHPWAEQPEYYDGNASLVHKTYYTTLYNGKYVRNFSICYDLDKMCSRWVAYPAHNIYTANRSYKVGGTTSGRTNAWAFDDAVTKFKESSHWSSAYEIVSTYISALDTYDTYTNPIIPQKRQVDIRFNNGFGSGYARGHMLPSADRYSTWNTNAQTCYSTNIMVQDYDFNSASWGTLENEVRTKVCADTLYVVVGTLFENNKTISKNNRTISVPSHCFKLLLRTKSGSTRKHIADIKSADELMCIGFLFENNATGANTALKDAAVSVAEIESRSGFSFFRNLDASIAEEVKSQCNFNEWKF